MRISYCLNANISIALILAFIMMQPTIAYDENGFVRYIGIEIFSTMIAATSSGAGVSCRAFFAGKPVVGWADMPSGKVKVWLTTLASAVGFIVAKSATAAAHTHSVGRASSSAKSLFKRSDGTQSVPIHADSGSNDYFQNVYYLDEAPAGALSDFDSKQEYIVEKVSDIVQDLLAREFGARGGVDINDQGKVDGQCPKLDIFRSTGSAVEEECQWHAESIRS